jgi:hypothetical protein
MKEKEPRIENPIPELVSRGTWKTLLDFELIDPIGVRNILIVRDYTCLREEGLSAKDAIKNIQTVRNLSEHEIEFMIEHWKRYKKKQML